MFYEYNQNNSGGSFDFDASMGITHHVIIEANSPEEANHKAEDIGLYFDGCDKGLDCPCCGDRWYPMWREEAGDPVPSIYGTPLSEYVVDYSFFLWMGNDPECFVHYSDGRVEAFTPSVKGE